RCAGKFAAATKGAYRRPGIYVATVGLRQPAVPGRERAGKRTASQACRGNGNGKGGRSPWPARGGKSCPHAPDTPGCGKPQIQKADAGGDPGSQGKAGKAIFDQPNLT